MSTNDFTYFGIGAALGAAAAMLLAPKSGSETRKVLRSKAEEGTDYLASRASEARDTAAVEGDQPWEESNQSRVRKI
jgi:gas vesicle protein